MKFLLFLLLGTLIFGFAFPALVLIVGFFALILLGLILFSFITGAFGGRRVTIYTSKGGYDPFAKRENRAHPADDPEVIGGVRREFESVDENDFGEDAEAEVVELPPTALRKDEDDV